MTHVYETRFEISEKTVLVFAEYKLTGGCPAHMGSLTYPGDPAESPELEFVKVEINVTDDDPVTAKAENYFAAPDWLVTILTNDDEVYLEICQDHDDADPREYEREED
jgi:hypothetical protein